VPHLMHQPDAEGHLQSVVSHKHVLEVERLAVLHPARTRREAEVEICDEDCQQGDWSTHKHPVLCAGICNTPYSISNLSLSFVSIPPTILRLP
jgi:hypothetical protein